MDNHNRYVLAADIGAAAIILVAVTMVSLHIWYGYQSGASGPLFKRPGTVHLYQYWAAFQAMLSGASPYDAVTVGRLQQALGFDGGAQWVSFNPPWLFVLMAPVLWWGFDVSVIAWGTVNVGLLGLASWLIWRTIREPGDRWLAGIIVVGRILSRAADREASPVLSAGCRFHLPDH